MQARLPGFAASGASRTPRLVATSCVSLGLLLTRSRGPGRGCLLHRPPDSLGVSWAFSSYLSPQLSAALQRTHCDAWPGSHGRRDRASLPRRPLTGLNEALCAHLHPCVCPGRDPRRPAGTRVASTECEMLPGTGPGAAGVGQEPGRQALRAAGLGGDVVGSWGCKARAKWPE